MRTALYVLLALSAPALAGQTVYKWVDEKGVTHFSDQPVAGADKVELSSGSNRSSANPAPSYSPPTASQSSPPVQKGPVYSRFVVESPQQDEAIINTGGVVTVRLSATPALTSGHVVTLYLDGSQVEGFPPNELAHELPNVPRGTHTVKAVVSDAQGKSIQETPPVTFHVRQTSVAQPPVGPAVRGNTPRRTTGNKLPTTQPSYAALNGGPAKMDPRTNMPVVQKPESKPTPKPAGPKSSGPKASK